MILTIFFALTIVSFGGMALMIVLRMKALRAREVVMATQPSLGSFVVPKANSAGKKLVIFIEELGRAVYLHLLLLLTKFFGLLRQSFGTWEQRVLRVINSIKGRGDLSNRGMTSLFLREINDHCHSQNFLTRKE